jgi:hypothetical protein
MTPVLELGQEKASADQETRPTFGQQDPEINAKYSVNGAIHKPN